MNNLLSFFGVVFFFLYKMMKEPVDCKKKKIEINGKVEKETKEEEEEIKTKS